MFLSTRCILKHLPDLKHVLWLESLYFCYDAYATHLIGKRASGLCVVVLMCTLV